MKVEKFETIRTPIDIIITGARLLTREEAKALPKRLQLYCDLWWTSSAYSLRSSIAFCMNGFYCIVVDVDVRYAYAVRPALIIEQSILKIGDRINVAGLEFEMITDNLAFCLEDIGTCAFREVFEAEDANQYEVSDIKKFVDKWFEENVK